MNPVPLHFVWQYTDVDRAFEVCIERTASEVGDPEGNRAVAARTCDIVKRKCETDPEGDLCAALLERYSSND